MSSSEVSPHIEVSGRRKAWYDREPFVVWLPFSALAAGVVQTVAYTGYKFFYNTFGVRPEEVGYDYTSLLPRTAFQLALLVSGVLALVGLLSFGFAFYAAIGKPFVDDWRESRPGSLAQSHGLRIVGCLFVGAIGASATGAVLGTEKYSGWIFLGLVAVCVVIGHLIAQDAGRPEASVLSAVLAPRTYRGARRLILVAVAAALPATDFGGSRDVGTILTVVALVYIVDLLLPVVNARRDADAPGGGRSRWLWRASILMVAGASALGGVAALSAIVDSSNLSEKVAQVALGEKLTYDLLNPLALAEPRADPVRVTWAGSSPPPLFKKRTSVPLTYFGQSGGTAVFLDTNARPQTVYRLPVAALEIEEVVLP
jgi:hypothetical protein